MRTESRWVAAAAAGASLLLQACAAPPEQHAEPVRHTEEAVVLQNPPGEIEPFAGNGTRGFSPGGQTAVFASLNSPQGLAVNPANGQVYIADTGNNRIVTVENGVLAAVVGGAVTGNSLGFGNLLSNPGAETPVPDGQVDVIPGWTLLTSGWSELTSDPFGLRFFPEPFDGDRYFGGGPNATDRLVAKVDVSGYPKIAQGTQLFNFTGFVRSLNEGGNACDEAQIGLQYRNAAGTVLSTFDSGGIASLRWTRVTDVRAAPVGTKKIWVNLIGYRNCGTTDDAYFDGLSLRALPPGNGVGDGGPLQFATLDHPRGMAFAGDGHLYVADSYNSRVRDVNLNDWTISSIGTGVPGATNGAPDVAQFDLPVDIATFEVYGVTQLNVVDIFNPGFRYFYDGRATPRVVFTQQMFGGLTLNHPVGAAIDPIDGLWATERSRFAPIGTRSDPGPAWGFTDRDAPLENGPFGTYGRLQGIAIAPVVNGSSQYVPHTAFISDLTNHAIRHVGRGGEVQTVVGRAGLWGGAGDGGPGYQASLMQPTAIAFNNRNQLFIADAEDNRVRVLNCASWDRSAGTDIQCVSPGVATVVANPINANDGNQCTVDRIWWTTGQVTHRAPSYPTLCSDGDACNGIEACEGTVCMPGTTLNVGASCGDGNACNGDEKCDAAHKCQPGTLPSIDDFNPCTVDMCSASGGVTHAGANNGLPCVASDPCQSRGTCQNGTCITTAIILNEPVNPCITESCNSTTGVVRSFNTGSCPGGTCVAGVCVPSGGFPSNGGLNNTVPPSSGSIFAAIYDPTNGVQTGATVGTAPGQLNPDHAAHLFGTVALSDGTSPLGVSVVVLNHPEFGQTLVRADGKFDIVANGGGSVVLRFSKACSPEANAVCYLPADRQAAPIWGAGAHMDDVVLVKRDPVSTSIAIDSGIFQDAAGSTTTAAMDPRGQRTVRVIFPPHTMATAVSLQQDGGTTTTLTNLTVRATEFTVGTSAAALSRMPAPLPATSLYTYAAEFTVDEAPNAGSVEFSPPVFAYLENFLGTPTGANVPDGYYDRDRAAWLPEHNGKVVAVVGYDANGALIDITGDGAETQADTDAWASTPTNERLTPGERSLIAARYPGGTSASPKSLWRVPLTHFSLHDFNHGGGVECVDGKCPDFGGAISGGADAPKDGSCGLSGSIIGAEEQSLGERLPIMGTPFALNYKSSYTLGYLPPRGVEVDFVDPILTNTLVPNESRVSLATPGGGWNLIRPARLNNYISWNGLDGAGRRVNGSQLATIQATRVYSASYKKTGVFGDASDSDTISLGYSTSTGSAPEVYYTRTFTKTLSAWGADTLGFGGWTLTPMHVYDPTSGTLYQGDGVQRSGAGRVLRLIAGNGTQTSGATGTLAVNSGIPSPGGSANLFPITAVASNGDVYLLVSEDWPSNRHTLRKIEPGTGNIVDVLTLPLNSSGTSYSVGLAMAFSPDGKFLYIPTFTQVLQVKLATKEVSVLAGNGLRATTTAVDGPGTLATFGNMKGIAVAPDGSVYVSEEGRVRKVSPDGAHTVSTVAGSGSATLSCHSGNSQSNANGKPAKQVALGGLSDLDFGLSVAPDGTLWIGSGYDIVRVDASGLAWCHTEQPGEVDSNVAVGPDNTVYFARNDWQDTSNKEAYSLRTLNTDGTTTLIAGGKGRGVPTDGSTATSTPIGQVLSMSVGPDGSLYFINLSYDGGSSPSARIYQLTPPPKSNVSGCEISLPSEDGLQKFCFDKDGRHLSTLNARTGETLLTFNYGTDGLLTSIHDSVDSNDTIIDRTPTLVTITGPFGQTTKIGLDPTTKYATYVEDATQRPTYVTHNGQGLLLSMTDRNNQAHTFAYDSMGRLKQDSNPAGFQILQRTETSTASSSGYSVSDTTAMGATRSFAVSVDASGTEMRTVTLVDGSKNESTLSRTGNASTTFGDRRTVTTTSALDPVSLVAYDNYAKTTFPSGRSTTVTRAKTVSGTVLTEQVALNGGAPSTRSYDSATKTYTLKTPNSLISPTGRTSTIAVDAYDRPLTVTPPTGIAPTTYHYDHGRLDSVSQGTRQTQLFYYPTGTSTPGRLKRVRVTDGAGAISTLIVPDNAGRTRSSTTCVMNTDETACASGAVETDMDWDFEGNLKSVTPPGKQAHTQAYTGTNLLQSFTPPAVPDVPAPATSFFYNRDGALEYVQQPGNRYVDYVDDPATGQLLSDGNAQFAYYPSSDNTGWTKGFLRTAQTATVSQTFAYDGPLLTGEGTAWSNGSASIDRHYNADLRLESESVSFTPNGGSTSTIDVNYGYDVDGLVLCASMSTCAPGASNKLAFDYEPVTGLLRGAAIGVVSEVYTRNAYGEVDSYTAKIASAPFPFLSRYYEAIPRDGFGRIVGMVGAYGRRNYSYDEQGRLAWVRDDQSVGLAHYTYDDNGNRLSTSPLSTTPIATYDAQDRLLTYAGASYEYGPNGELRKQTKADGGVAEFNYDPLGYLKSAVTTGGTSISYSYDGFGRRIERTTGSTSTRYLYRDRLAPVAVLDGSGVLLARFVYALHSNVPELMVLRDGTVFRYIVDQLGSPLYIINVATGDVAERASYDEFGVRTYFSHSGAFPVAAQPFGFAGGLYDEYTGLVHFGARDYDPVVGRWVSKDPALFGGGQANLYVYSGNDPVDYRDPSGNIIVSAGASETLAEGRALSDASGWLVQQASAEWAAGSYGAALLTGAQGLAVGLLAALSNPAIDALGIGMPLSPAMAGERRALHDLTKEAMGLTGKEMTRADAEILAEWAREQGTKGLIHGPHGPPVDFAHAHIDTFNHIPICDK